MIDFIANRLFAEILNMSLTGSIVILAVLFIRLFLRKAPKKWSYLLWLVVAFRLACPVSLPSPVSLLGAVNAPVTAQGTIEYIDRPAVQPQITIPLPAVPSPGLTSPDIVAAAPQVPIEESEKLEVEFLPDAEPILQDILMARDMYNQVKYAGLSEEEIEQYEILSDKIRSNIQKSLK